MLNVGSNRFSTALIFPCALLFLQSCTWGKVIQRVPAAATTAQNDGSQDSGTDTTTVTVYGAVPTGAVAAFDNGACPTGWTAFTQANGRFVVGVGTGNQDPDGNNLTARTLGQTGGREYTTGIPASTSTSNTTIAPSAAAYLRTTTPTEIYISAGFGTDTTLDGAAADSNLPPYIVRTYCKRTATTDDAVPSDMSVHLNNATCPSGFSADSDANGRFILGAGSGNTDAESVALTSRTLATTGGLEYTSGIPAITGTTGSVGTPNPALFVTRNTSTDIYTFDTSGGITSLSGSITEGNLPPYATLKTCKRDGTALATIDTGVIMHFDLSSCPSGWTTYTDGQGRFLLGAGNGNTDIDGNNLTNRVLGATGGREFTTGMRGVNDSGIQSAPSPTALFARTSIYTTDAPDTTIAGAKADSNMPPYIALLTCVKQ